MKSIKNDLNSIDGKKTVSKKVYWIFASALLLAFVYCIGSFVFGVASIFGRDITIISSIQMIFAVFNMNALWYLGIFSAAFSFIYLVLLFLMIKNFVKSIPVLKSFFTEEMNDDNVAKENILAYAKTVGSTVFMSITYIVTCNLFKAFLLRASFYILLASWIVIWLCKRIICAFIDGNSTKSVLIQSGYDALIILPFIVILMYAKQPAFSDFKYHLREMLSLTAQGAIGTIRSILLMVILVSLLVELFRINEAVKFHDCNLKQVAKVLLVSSVGLFIAEFAKHLANGVPRFGTEMLVMSLLPALPFILVSSACLIVGYLAEDVEKKMDDEPTDDSEEKQENPSNNENLEDKSNFEGASDLSTDK